jgi:aspartate carbamoyltransferase catalytic subunit
LSDDLKAQLPAADAVYMTRVQNEWDASDGESTTFDASRFRIGLPELAIMKPDSAILHPLPRRDEISTDVDHDPRAVYWRQMRNGMWIRAALIASLFGIEGQIMTYSGA